MIVEGRQVLTRTEFVWEYLKFIRQHKLKPESAPVLAGGGCLMLGLRQHTSDIDMDVPPKLYDQWKVSGRYKIKNYYNPDMEMIEMTSLIDVNRGDSKIQVMVLDGVGMWTPEEILKFKRSLNRPKDQADIKALEELIQKRKKGTWVKPD